MRTLIVGIGGQDGAYLARHLIASGDSVWGTSRAPGVPDTIDRLGLTGKVVMRCCDPAIPGALAAIIAESEPDEVYYLAAQSSVARSFTQPAEALNAVVGFAHLLETTSGMAVRILDASSIDCFGEAPEGNPITEKSSFSPRSPYAVGKIAQSTLAKLAREADGRFVATAYLGNHESPLRDGRFVTRKIVDAARRIAAGTDETLRLGDVDVVRDWGWAPDYVQAMPSILRHDTPDAYVIATGKSVPLSHFVASIFAALDLDWRAHVQPNVFPPRPLDIRTQHADPMKAQMELGWRATSQVDAVANLLAREGGHRPSA